MTSGVTFDDGALRRISFEVDDHAFVWMFASRYRQMLIGRVSRITTALQQHNEEAALDAVLSLKVASATVGTAELVDLARTLEGQVRAHDLAGARLLAGRLWPAALRADRALAAYLAR